MGEALHLACAGRSEECDYCILAEACSALVVDDAASAEDGAESVRTDCNRLVVPVDEVFRSGVSPCHVLPLGAVRVILIVEMPDAIFVEHAVGVVHPAIEGSVVESRAILLLFILNIDVLYHCHSFPASIFLSFAHRVAALGSDYVKHYVLSFVGRKIEGHHIVGLRLGETHEDGLGYLAVDKDVDFCVVYALLHREHEILIATCHSYERVVDSEMVDLEAIGSRCSDSSCGYHSHCGHCCDESFDISHIYYVFFC